jgi:hypothetical protein
MKRIFTLAAACAVVCGSAAFADTTIESTSSTPGSSTSSSTTIMQSAPAQPNVIVAPAVESSPTVTKTKRKIHRHGLFHNTKVKEETETVTP